MLPQSITDTIYTTFISDTTGLIDKPRCSLVANDRFSTASAYYYLLNKENRSVQTMDNFKWIWKLNCPNKIKFFIWLTYYNRLLTTSYLNYIGMYVNTVCKQCQQTETIDHIFRACSSTLTIWEANNLLLIIDKHRLLSTKDWLLQCSRMKHIKFGNYFFWSDASPFYLWSIQLTRNDNLFNNKSNHVPAQLARDRDIEFHSQHENIELSRIRWTLTNARSLRLKG